MNIDLAVLDRQFKLHKNEYEAAALRVLNSGWYVLGSEVQNFEQEFAAYVGRKHCVGLNSGLDALILSIRAMGIGAGDEVIVQANTYIATVLGITENGARPVFVEPDEYHGIDVEAIERAITSRTKAIMVVHLYGQACQMDKLVALSVKHNIPLIEDCAQSHGAKFCGKITGSFGLAGCFSFYPTKNLGAFGDGGAVLTDDDKLAEKLRMLRNYGSKIKYHNEIEGVNSRLDEMQAALLRVKLAHLDELNAERNIIAYRFYNGITNSKIELPKLRANANHVYHQFVVIVQEREVFQRYLQYNGIKTGIHYPIPPHIADCYKHLGYDRGDFPTAETLANKVLSLPIFNGMTEEEMEYVINVCNKY